MPSRCDLCTAIDPTGAGGPLEHHLRPDQPRILARTTDAAVVPTIGAFVAGYVLIVPARHTTSIGMLTPAERRAVHELTEQLAKRIADVYASPVVGFEYGLNLPGGRRIEHGHQHLLPSTAGPALRRYLGWRLSTSRVESMEHLPEGADQSYISVFEPGRPLSLYPVANDAAPRIRLREVVALLDPQVDARRWDWQSDPCADLMRRTIDDLGGTVRDRSALAGAGQR
ncbi:HIT domain-containing protein [Nucisporomicrobium flavum]|uniref:HIT domain-containing protein n=1 Tax=Nucisporomicrobium flavum TaxID=2785915 RepID=UPI0018F31E20|nr:HIT domain-containing protein [Nucisporomicrobium flavum]